MKMTGALAQKLIVHINRKEWWHVPPRDPAAYRKRGKFFASSFREAEFWGRPLDAPQSVAIAKPLIGDERTIEKTLLGRQISFQEMTMKARWALDAKLRRAAVGKGYDAIVLLTDKAFSEFLKSGKIPRSIELNVLHAGGGSKARRGSSVRLTF